MTNHVLCYVYSLKVKPMSNLIPFTPTDCDMPVAMGSPNLPSWVKDVLNDNWHKVSSGLGNHTYVEDMIQDVTDPEVLQEYWDEYSV